MRTFADFPYLGSAEKAANLAEKRGGGKSAQAIVPGGSWHSWQQVRPRS